MISADCLRVSWLLCHTHIHCEGLPSVVSSSTSLRASIIGLHMGCGTGIRIRLYCSVLQVATICAAESSCCPATWRLQNLLQLYKAGNGMHAACCALQPMLKPKDWQLPCAASCEPGTLPKLAQRIFGDGASRAGKLCHATTASILKTPSKVHQAKSLWRA